LGAVKFVIVTLGVIWRKPVVTHASRGRETLLASVNSVNFATMQPAPPKECRSHEPA